jgi:hypothetical protein
MTAFREFFKAFQTLLCFFGGKIIYIYKVIRWKNVDQKGLAFTFFVAFSSLSKQK